MISQRLGKLQDNELLLLIAKGNDLAFSHFYDRYWDLLFISAYKILKDEEACKDIVQEVFLSIWENKEVAQITNARVYLFQSVRYRVLMALRKGKITQKHLETIQTVVANTTEEELNFKELNKTIEATIKSLPDRCQEVFKLSRMEHLSNPEIAKKLNISIRTVETHISNALKQIRSSLDSSAATIIILLLLQ